MKLRSLLGGGLLLRAVATELKGIRLQLTRQADALAQLATYFAPPVLPEKPDPSVVDGTGLSYLDANEMMLALDYIDRTERALHKVPTEDEVLTYLADERTVDLQIRLRQREEELLMRDRDRRGEQ